MTTRKYIDGECIEEVKDNELQKKDVNETRKIEKLEPGEKLVTEIKIHDVWKSVLEKQLGDLRLIVDFINFLTCMSESPLLKGINFFSSICSKILSCMTVGHVLEFVEVTTLEGSTTQIPYEVIVAGVSNKMVEEKSNDMLREVESTIAEGILNEMGSKLINDTPLFNSKLSTDSLADSGIPYNYTDYISSTYDFIGAAECYKTLYEDIIYRFKKADGDVNTKFYVVRADGVRQLAPNSGVVNGTAEYGDFDIEIVDGKYTVDEDGGIILESDAIIKVTPKKANIKAVIGAVSEDGEEIIRIPLIVVDEHECKGEYVILTPPGNGKGAYMASFCDTCHELIECKQFSVEEIAMLSNGKGYSSLSDVIADVENTDEELKLYIFGDVNIDDDVTLPATIVPIIMPDTNITVKDGCKFIAEGEGKDYSSYNYNLSGNGPLISNTTDVQQQNEWIWGDANCDGQIDLSDAVLIMQSVANPNKYDLGGTSPMAMTEKGKKQADVDTSTVGITGNDALKIQKYLLKLISSLEPSK